MNFLLDTNVVSEWVKPRPNAGVMHWLASVDEDRVHLSVVTLAELRHGIQRLSPGARRTRLEHWLQNDLAQRFATRILPVDAILADHWGRVLAQAEAVGRPAGGMDALVAATSACFDLTLVTRNVSHFAPLGIRIINPWDL